MRWGLGRFLLASAFIGLLVFVGLALAAAATQVPMRVLVLCLGLAALTGLSLRRLSGIPVLPNRIQYLAAAAGVGGVAIVASVLDAEASALPFVIAFLALVTLAGLARDVSLGMTSTGSGAAWNGLERRGWNGLERRGAPAVSDSQSESE